MSGEAYFLCYLPFRGHSGMLFENRREDREREIERGMEYEEREECLIGRQGTYLGEGGPKLISRMTTKGGA